MVSAGAERDVLQRGLECRAPLGWARCVAHGHARGARCPRGRKERLDGGRSGSRVGARAALDRLCAAVRAVPAHREHVRALCVHAHTHAVERLWACGGFWGVRGCRDKPIAHVRRNGRPSWRTWLRTQASSVGAGAGGGLCSAACGAQSSWPASTSVRSCGSRCVPLPSVAVIHSQCKEKVSQLFLFETNAKHTQRKMFVEKKLQEKREEGSRSRAKRSTAACGAHSAAAATAAGTSGYSGASGSSEFSGSSGEGGQVTSDVQTSKKTDIEYAMRSFSSLVVSVPFFLALSMRSISDWNVSDPLFFIFSSVVPDRRSSNSIIKANLSPSMQAHSTLN